MQLVVDNLENRNHPIQSSEKKWFLYIIRGKDSSLYTGITTDVARRFLEHQSDNGKGAKYLQGRSPLALVYQAEIGSQSEALRIEYLVKKTSKNLKEKLVSEQLDVRKILGEKL